MFKKNQKQKIAELMKANKYADAFKYFGKAIRENTKDGDHLNKHN
jgi:hypothetical protein